MGCDKTPQWLHRLHQQEITAPVPKTFTPNTASAKQICLLFPMPILSYFSDWKRKFKQKICLQLPPCLNWLILPPVRWSAAGAVGMSYTRLFVGGCVGRLFVLTYVSSRKNMTISAQGSSYQSCLADAVFGVNVLGVGAVIYYRCGRWGLCGVSSYRGKMRIGRYADLFRASVRDRVKIGVRVRVRSRVRRWLNH